ncbi:40742_t:CDS:2, partial [Gigaspora margarita]
MTSNFSPQPASQTQNKTNKGVKSNKNKNHKQIALDQALRTSDIGVLSTNIVKSNNSKSSKDSWVWKYMQKDVLNKQVACNIIMVSLDGRKKKCDKVYSISTSTTHLGEHLSTIHRIFPSKKYEKNSEGQTIIISDNSAQTIPSMLSKIDSHKPAKQQRLVFRDENLEQSEDTFESVQQIFNTESIPSISNLSSLSNLSSESNLSSISSQSSISNLSFSKQKNQKILEPIRDVKTRWNSTYLVLRRLVQLQDATEQLAKSLCQHPEIQQRKDGQSLSNPLMECYISSYLDPRFKNMNFISKKKKENVQNKLSKIVEMATNTIDTLVQTKIDCFYDGEIQIEHLIDDELERYEKVTQMNKYQINHPLCKFHNPLI